MHRFLALLLSLALVAAACGGGGDGDAADDTTGDTTAGDTPTDDSADGDITDGDGDPADEADGGGSVTDEGGGEADQGLAESLGLPECPVGAHLEAEGTVEIDFWHPLTTLSAEAMEDIGAAFNASQDKIVVNVEAQGSYGELLAAYRESIRSDDLPAIAITDRGAFRDMVDSGTVLPAQSCVEADGYELSGIDDLVRSYFSIDGALYPAAMNISTPVLYYNRTHFEAAGLDPDAPPQTLAEVRDAAQAIKDAGVAETPLSLLLQGEYIENWLGGVGVQIVNADNGRAGNATEATFNGPEALEVFETLQEMADAGTVVAYTNTPGQTQHYFAALGPSSMLFETSTASVTIASFLGGTGNLSELITQAEEAGVDVEGVTDLTVDISVAPFPGLEEAGRVAISGGAYYMTNTGTDAEQAAAWEFMKFVNEFEQQKVVHLKASYLPINEDVLNDPEVQSVWQTDAAGQWLATAHAQLSAIDPENPGPAIGPFSEQRGIFNRSLEELMLEGRDPADILADAEADLNEALEDYVDANF